MPNLHTQSTYVWPSWPIFSEEEIEAVTYILRSGKVNYWTGQEGKKFEHEFARYIGTRYAVAVMNGTVALEAALLALGITANDEVITTSRTFIASASAVILRGAMPIFADVDAESQNITADTIAAKITPRTKAIICVHLAGWPCAMDAIVELARQHNLYVIEDCAQAHGAEYKGKKVGSWGDIAAFSFCQDKIMTTAGEGGMVATNNPDSWEKIWAIKDHGKSYEAVFCKVYPPGFRWLHESFGTNWRMTEIQAAVGRLQLQKLPKWLQQRQDNARILHDGLRSFSCVRLTSPSKEIFHAYYKYYIFIQPDQLKLNWTRDRILQTINQRGVNCSSGSCSEIYLEKAFQHAGLQPKERLPVAKQLGETSLMFLVHPSLSEENMHRMSNTIAEVLFEASLS